MNCGRYKPLAEQLRCQILDNYIKYNWNKYYIIRIKDILTSFLLEYDLDDFVCLCAKHMMKDKSSFENEFSSFLLNSFREMHKQRIIVQNIIKSNTNDLKDDRVYSFYFKDLPIFTNNIKEYLDKITPNGFTTIYQVLGNNVRTSGKPYNSSFNPENIFLLAQRTNALIKILRRRSLDDGSRVLVAIDSIRNPYEASFFRERYCGRGIYTNKQDRRGCS